MRDEAKGKENIAGDRARPMSAYCFPERASEKVFHNTGAAHEDGKGDSSRLLDATRHGCGAYEKRERGGGGVMLPCGTP